LRTGSEAAEVTCDKSVPHTWISRWKVSTTGT